MIPQEVKTNIIHNIDEFEFKLAIAKTSDLIKYVGIDYLKKLNELNNQYSNTKVKYFPENYDNI